MYGGTTKVFQHYFQKYCPDGLLVTADIRVWKQVEDFRVRQGIVHSHRHDNDSVSVNRRILQSELLSMGIDFFDFAFVDGDHAELSLLRDLEIYWSLSTPPHYALLDDTKDEAHECCFTFQQKLRKNYKCYDFEDWPIFVGASLIWEAAFIENATSKRIEQGK